MGNINGEISIAPIITAEEFVFNLIEARNAEQMRIYILQPLSVMPLLIASMIFSLSVPLCMLKIPYKTDHFIK